MNENLKRTIIGAVAGVTGVLVALGLFTPEQSQTATQAATGLIENLGGLILGVFAIWGVITGGEKGAK